MCGPSLLWEKFDIHKEVRNIAKYINDYQRLCDFFSKYS